MNINDENEVSIAGNITFTDVKTGTHGLYGTIGVALYTRKTHHKSDQTDFVNVDIGSSFFKIAPNPQKGDRIALKCHLTTQQEGQNKGKLLLKCSYIKSYLSVDAKRLLQDKGFIKKPQQQQGGFVQQQAPQQQGGFQQQVPQQQGGFTQQKPQRQGGHN